MLKQTGIILRLVVITALLLGEVLQSNPSNRTIRGGGICFAEQGSCYW